MHEKNLYGVIQKMLIPRLAGVVCEVKKLPWREDWEFRMSWIHVDAGIETFIPPRIGFTGNRNGMTPSQKAVFCAIIDMTHPKEFHEGDCVGSDAEATYAIHEWNANVCYTNAPYTSTIISHPPEDPKLRAYISAHKEYPAMPYLARNRSIVDCCDFMIATPSSSVEVKRGGTWYTIRYARRKHVPMFRICPDGYVIFDGSYHERERAKFETGTGIIPGAIVTKVDVDH